LDFLGFSRPNREFSIGYTEFSAKKISRALPRERSRGALGLSVRKAGIGHGDKLRPTSDFPQGLVARRFAFCPQSKSRRSRVTFTKSQLRLLDRDYRAFLDRVVIAAWPRSATEAARAEDEAQNARRVREKGLSKCYRNAGFPADHGAARRTVSVNRQAAGLGAILTFRALRLPVEILTLRECHLGNARRRSRLGSRPYSDP
jgi:hypothetical protein